MKPIRVFGCCLALLTAGSLAGCAIPDNALIPADVQNAVVPDGSVKNAHAVYLYDIGDVHYDPIEVASSFYPTYAFTRASKIKLLDRAACERIYGNIFLEHLGDLYGIEARVIKPDGTRVELKPGDFIKTVLIRDAIKGVTPPIDYNQTAMIFPGLEPGDIIEYKYTKRGASLNWSFNHVDAPVLYSKFRAARPLQRTEIQPVLYDIQKLGLEDAKSTNEDIASGMAGYVGNRKVTLDVWTVRNVPAITFEEAMPPPVDLASRVYVFQSDRRVEWSTLGDAYYRWFTQYGTPSAKAKEVASQVVAGISEPRGRARAIHNWVKKNLNIVARDQVTPAPREYEITTTDIKKILEEKNATPEQAANLMFLMMQAVGVEPTIVLTTHVEAPPVIEDLPDTGQFTHPLLALDDGTLIDTTSRLCPFGMAPWVFEGRRSLYVKIGSSEMKTLPVSAQTDNRREITIESELDEDGKAKISAKINLTGQMAYAFRRWLMPKQAKEKEESMRKMATIAADRAEVDDFSFVDLDDPEKPLGINLTYHVAGYAQILKDQMILKTGAFIGLVSCPVLSEPGGRDQYICPYPTSETRKNPIQFAFKRLDEMKVNIVFPLGFYLKALPKSIRTREIDRGTSVGVQTAYSSDKNEGKNMRVERKFSVNEILIGAKSYPNLRDLLRAYLAQADSLLTLELPKME